MPVDIPNPKINRQASLSFRQKVLGASFVLAVSFASVSNYVSHEAIERALSTTERKHGIEAAVYGAQRYISQQSIAERIFLYGGRHQAKQYLAKHSTYPDAQ